VVKLLLPFGTYWSPSRRVVPFMPPKAWLPEPGSVMSQAAIFSIVSSSSPQRCFCARAPLLRMEAAVRPSETPMAVTLPGQKRHSSMMGMSCMAAESPPSARTLFSSCSAAFPAARAGSAAFSFPIWCLKRCRAISSMPKLRITLRSTSSGGVSPCSSSSRQGLISVSTNLRTASRIIWWDSLHSIMTCS